MPKDEVIPEDLEKCFPYLKMKGYRKTSESTLDEAIKYNCIAHAMGENQQWWQPPIWGQFEPGQYWPPEAPIEHELNTYISVFELRGYTVCDTPDLEPNYEKVAVYWSASGPHAAIQLPSGEWSSKLGDEEDIAHNTLDGLETDGNLPAYGKLRQILKRPMQSAQ